MTVADLLCVLELLPKDAEVYIKAPEEWYPAFVGDVLVSVDNKHMSLYDMEFYKASYMSSKYDLVQGVCLKGE